VVGASLKTGKSNDRENRRLNMEFGGQPWLKKNGTCNRTNHCAPPSHPGRRSDPSETPHSYLHRRPGTAGEPGRTGLWKPPDMFRDVRAEITPNFTLREFDPASDKYD